MIKILCSLRSARLILVLTALSGTVSAAPSVDDYPIELYDIYCTACHAVKASGAPQAFTDEWRDRLDKGMETLVNHAINGVGNMPPMGTCVECSAEDLENIIHYMAQEQ